MNKDTRLSKIMYYLNIADAVSRRSTCLKCRVGAVVVIDDRIVATGYNGAPRGQENCFDKGECARVNLGYGHGEGYHVCPAVHAEANAIINSSRFEMMHATMYLYSYDLMQNCVLQEIGCCRNCRRMIINAGIEQVIFADPNGIDAPYPYNPQGYGYTVTNVSSWITLEGNPPIST